MYNIDILWPLKLYMKIMGNTMIMKKVKNVLTANRLLVTLWIAIWSSIDSYYTVRIFDRYQHLVKEGTVGEVNIFYNFTPMSIEETMIVTTVLGIVIGFLCYKKYPVITEIIAYAVTLFGMVNLVSYYFVPLEYKQYLHTAQFIVLLLYIPISYLYRDKESGNLRPLFIPSEQ